MILPCSYQASKNSDVVLHKNYMCLPSATTSLNSGLVGRILPNDLFNKDFIVISLNLFLFSSYKDRFSCSQQILLIYFWSLYHL